MRRLICLFEALNIGLRKRGRRSSLLDLLEEPPLDTSQHPHFIQFLGRVHMRPLLLANSRRAYEGVFNLPIRIDSFNPNSDLRCSLLERAPHSAPDI